MSMDQVSLLLFFMFSEVGSCWTWTIFLGFSPFLFWPVRTGIIYLLSAYTGTLVAALFAQNSPSVGSSGALFGLLGAMISGIIRNWKLYTDRVYHSNCFPFWCLYFLGNLNLEFIILYFILSQFLALGSVLAVFAINFGLGLLPYIDNFANVGGLASGVLLGFTILFTLQHRQEKAQTKGYSLSYSFKNYFNLKMKQKLDKPILRSTSLLLFALLWVLRDQQDCICFLTLWGMGMLNLLSFWPDLKSNLTCSFLHLQILRISNWSFFWIWLEQVLHMVSLHRLCSIQEMALQGCGIFLCGMHHSIWYLIYVFRLHLKTDIKQRRFDNHTPSYSNCKSSEKKATNHQ